MAGKHAAYEAFDFGPLDGVVNPKKEKQKAAMEAEKKAAAAKAAAEEAQATRVTTSAEGGAVRFLMVLDTVWLCVGQPLIVVFRMAIFV